MFSSLTAASYQSQVGVGRKAVGAKCAQQLGVEVGEAGCGLLDFGHAEAGGAEMAEEFRNSARTPAIKCVHVSLEAPIRSIAGADCRFGGMFHRADPY
jgi:hypothetical protein